MDLKGRAAIITGAGRGIGRVISFRLAEYGAKVIVNDVVSEDGGFTVEKIKENEGLSSFVQADISDWEGARELAKKAKEEFGTIDILVNNAGITRDKLLRDMEEEDWDKVLNINLKGVFNCCKFVVPDMVEKKYGKIVNMSSRAYLGNPGQVNYSASKAGILGFTRSLAMEVGRYNINVNAVVPGMVDTELVKSHPKYEQIVERALKSTPLQRVGKPEDIAGLVHFLVSDESSYITGEAVHITGGRY
jgi:3-oxoacyl-[acyl-carrier protein] reductase